MDKRVLRVVRHVTPHWVGDGFPVRGLFSYLEAETFDPFLLLDYAGPYEFASSSRKRGVGEHPHRGFETVTIVYAGEVEHRDSGGHHGSIGPGDVQWMTAAAGVVHEEFHSERFTRDGGKFELVQLWVNLPARHKRTTPRYQSLTAAQIPHHTWPDVPARVRVIAGDLLGTHGAAQTFSPINVWDVQWDEAATLRLPVPAGHTTLSVLQAGTCQVGGETIAPGELALLDPSGDALVVQSLGAARMLVLTGAPLREPVAAHGPFVMNSRDEIREAIADYQAGRMGRLE